MPKLFLSYASADRDTARVLGSALRDEGVDVWVDQLSLSPGESPADAIRDAVVDADGVLVLVTPNSVGSSWFADEWSWAIGQSARVIPVLAGGITVDDLVASVSMSDGGIHPAGARGAVEHLRAAVDLRTDHAVATLVARAKALDAAPNGGAAEAEVARIVETTVEQVLSRLGAEPAGEVRTDDEDDSLIFVIISFDPEMEYVFAAISAAAEVVGMRAMRVKDRPGDYRIDDETLSMIGRARFVVADLTHERPNVYFELGYARGLGKTVVTIVRRGGPVHFDVRNWSYLEYVDSRPLEADLVERFGYELRLDDGA